jgi:predicted transcriptional regulator of viral defense system
MRGVKEERLARWLAGHHGVVTATEALSLGISTRELRELVRHGRLRRAHPGVYIEAHLREHPAIVASAAALGAAGPRAALSHGSAAWIWDMLPEAPARVHLLMPDGGERQLAQVHVHRARSAFASGPHNGLRVTDPIRTLIDLAGQTPTLLTGAIDRALAQQLVRFSDLTTAVDRSAAKGFRGVIPLRAHLTSLGYLGAPAPSVLESRGSSICSRRAAAPTDGIRGG